jgi:hypothetical protein
MAQKAEPIHRPRRQFEVCDRHVAEFAGKVNVRDMR